MYPSSWSGRIGNIALLGAAMFVAYLSVNNESATIYLYLGLMAMAIINEYFALTHFKRELDRYGAANEAWLRTEKSGRYTMLSLAFIVGLMAFAYIPYMSVFAIPMFLVMKFFFAMRNFSL